MATRTAETLNQLSMRFEDKGAKVVFTRSVNFGISDLHPGIVSKRCGETGRAFTVFA